MPRKGKPARKEPEDLMELVIGFRELPDDYGEIS